MDSIHRHNILLVFSILTLLTASTLAQDEADDGLNPGTRFMLTPVEAIPATYTVPTDCFTGTTQLDEGTLIWNVGCGIRSRRSCCPPNYNTDVMFLPQTATATGGKLDDDGCPGGYLADPVWGELTGKPIMDEVTSTVVCCPKSVHTWKINGAGMALCYTQQYKSVWPSSGTRWYSTFARPFFVAAAVEALPTASSKTNTQGSSRSSSSRNSISSVTGISSTSSSAVADNNSRTGSSSVAGPVATETSATEEEEEDTGRSGLSPGVIAGIAFGVIIPIFLAIGLFAFYRRRKIFAATGGNEAGRGPRGDEKQIGYHPHHTHQHDLSPIDKGGLEEYPMKNSSGTLESGTPYSMRSAEVADMPTFGVRPYQTENYAVSSVIENMEKRPVEHEVNEVAKTKRISGRGM